MDFKLTGISIGMDIAIIFAALGLIYALWKDRHERMQREVDAENQRKQREVDAVNKLMLDQIKEWDQLIENFFDILVGKDEGDLVSIHKKIWSNLKELRMLAAANAQKEIYDTLAKHMNAYKGHMESNRVKDGFIELGRMLRSMMALVQKNEEVLDNYFNDRFGECMRNNSA